MAEDVSITFGASIEKVTAGIQQRVDAAILA